MKKDYNFGYTKVNSKQKTKLVQNVFSSVAPSYDIMNDLMSLGMHRLWKKRFVETVDLKENEIILDVGSGSGDIASEILKENLSTSLYLLDLNEEMLLEGKKRLKKEKNIKYFIGNAEKLNFENWLSGQSVDDLLSFTPIIENGLLIGLEVSPGEDSRLYDELELIPGDILISINGMNISELNIEDNDSIESFLESTNALNFLIKRGEDQINLNFDVGKI